MGLRLPDFMYQEGLTDHVKYTEPSVDAEYKGYFDKLRKLVAESRKSGSGAGL